MSLPKRSKNQQPLDYQELQKLEELHPVDMGAPNERATPWNDIDRQLQDGMGELQLMFNRLAPPPSSGKEPDNRSNPIIHNLDDKPLPVVTGSWGQVKGTHTRNSILNPEDIEPEIEEKSVQPMQLTEEDPPPQELDAETRFLAIRFFNLVLAKLWRRRRAEVCDLHTLVRKYQAHAARTQTELFTRNQMICSEQRRGEQLNNQLMQAVSRVRVTMESCAELDNELQQLRIREVTLSNELASKSLECEYFAEMLDSFRSDMFRELANYRKGAAELANQQRRALQFEFENAELEDQLLTIKDQFLQQNDQMSVALGEKKQELDAAYETLKHYEQELLQLEMKYQEMLRQTGLEVELQKEISLLKKNMSMPRFFILYLSACKWGTFHGCVYHVVAGTLDCLAPSFSAPPMTNNLLRMGMAAIFLLYAMY
ncbi:uncharacterized protein LOC6550995 [Drosophila erecta]|uniref:Uncharacterized protein n=1 Tax=Drosophila erecta TaxID=7220 RepID=B3NU22_DROER|nr:uncharacterized protein LOC6550995 [Drosophila erecta]EDV45798.1 uncharacterized protein Dere_GG18545 [Drosophila erecta]